MTGGPAPRETPQASTAGLSVEKPTPVDAAATSGRLLRTSGLVALVLGVGSVLGLVRDMLIARHFGASADTDAFLVAWTIPETVTPVLGEGALLYLLVPLLSREMELRGSPQRVLNRTLLPVTLTLAAIAAVTALAAPAVVDVLAPGLAEPGLAVRCVRAASVTVLFLGLSGYLTATLRSTGSFLVAPWIYTIYNLAIISLVVLFHEQMGVFSAAVGLAVGSAGMVALQLPAVLKRVSLRGLRLRADRRLLVSLTACLPIGVYALSRQGQVFVERIFGSVLAAGAISHLNYATKLAQIPMVAASMIMTVSMPSLARHAAALRMEEFRQGIQRALRLGVLTVVPATAVLVVLAPQIISVLFRHGEFSTSDVQQTAEVMRVYSLGLLGQMLVGATAGCFWALGRPSWYPAVIMAAGLGATALVSGTAMLVWGAPGIALGNAVGITLTAVLLLVGTRRRVVDIALRGIFRVVGTATVAAVAGGVAAWTLSRLLSGVSSALVTGLLGGLLLCAVYVVAAWFLGIPEIRVGAQSAWERLGRRPLTTEAQ